MRRYERGQILPLFALMLVAIMAMAALAFDVSNAYAARRAYRTAADAASLAGALDLQVAGTRAVGTAEYNAARQHAEEALERELNDTVTCVLTGNRSDCTFAALPYEASIVTPLPSSASCLSCDPDRSVQVSLGHPSFSLTFARVLGLGTWRVAVTAVAGLQHATEYTIFALRPPLSPTLPNVRSIRIDGNTDVFVVRGDVGTNANMTYGGSGSELHLDSGYRMDYFDPANPPLWSPSPIAHKITALVPDPAYPVPTKGFTPPTGAADTVANCTPIAAAIYANPNYAASVPVVAGVPDMSDITCYLPGVYSSELGVNNGELAILEPGLYFFDDGLDAQGSVIGGFAPGSEGVALVFPESSGTMFKNRTSGGSSSLTQIVALNAGTKYLNPAGQEASPARDYAGALIQTNTTPPKLMTVIVPPDGICRPELPLPGACDNAAENRNKAIDLSGGSGLYLAGVQYAPSDNITISGNTATGGYVGQVWAWTLTYTGGSVINQEGSQSTSPGTIRLDAACTAPGTPCVP